MLRSPSLALSLRAGGLFLAVVLSAGCASNHSGSPSGSPGEPPEVQFVTVTPQPVSYYGDFVGQVYSSGSVSVRPKVEGYLVQKKFEGGDPVQEGDLLFLIDQRPFTANLNK